MPTVLSLHDADGDERDFPPVLRSLAQGWTLLSPRLTGDREALLQYIRDNAREVPFAFGYGTGADLAAELLLNHPGVLAGAIMLRPKAVPAGAQSGNLGGAPVLIVTGAEDEGSDLAQRLSEAGARVELAVQNCGPDLTPQDFSLAKQWFAARLT